MRVRLLGIHAAVFVGVSVVTIAIWALTTRAYFWPIWPMLVVGVPLAMHAWAGLVDIRPAVARRQRLTRGLAIQEGLSVAFALFLVCVWAITSRGYFWPIWPILVLLVAFGIHAAVALGPAIRRGALAERIASLETSRAGVVDQQESELRRIERDLHDGAQARIVALGMSLGMAEQKLASDPEGAREMLADARRGAREALEELRDLARGIHPPVLADRGLEAAIAALASRTPLHVRVSVDLDRRPAAPVESAAYFIVAEALANVGKHAQAEHVDIAVRRRNESVLVEVVDDGVGGADVAGSGLQGLAKRVEALDGSLEIASPGRVHDRAGGAAMRVVIAEDLALLRDGLTRLLRDNGFDVVAAVSDGDALVRSVLLERPDIAIVDIRLPPTFRDEGLRAALELRERAAETGVLIVSQYVEQAYAAELLADGRGGVGYPLKDRIMDVDDFVDAVRRVATGGTALDPEVVAQLFSRRRVEGPIERLTRRETEVLSLMAEGRSNAAIARELVLTTGAVEKHVASILGKLQLPPSSDDHRVCSAVLAYLAGRPWRTAPPGRCRPVQVHLTVTTSFRTLSSPVVLTPFM